MDSQRRKLLAAGTIGGFARLLDDAAAGTAAPASPMNATAQDTSDDGRRDFDFYIGRWHVRARRLKQRFAGSDEWEEYEATDESRPILGGIGLIDDFRSEHFGGNFRGMALHLFDTRSRQWSNWWATNRTGIMDPPVSGVFKDGIGTFYGYDVDGERRVKVRFVWSGITASGARWEQAFSLDDGKTWETNAIFDMTRLGQ